MERWEGLLNKTARSISADLPGQGTVQREQHREQHRSHVSDIHSYETRKHHKVECASLPKPADVARFREIRVTLKELSTTIQSERFQSAYPHACCAVTCL